MGHRAGTRRLVDHAAAFAAYAECDPRADLDREAYLTHFTFRPRFRRAPRAGALRAGLQRPVRGPLALVGHRPARRPASRPERRQAALRGHPRPLPRTRRRRPAHLPQRREGGARRAADLVWHPEPSPSFHDTAKRFALAHAERAGIAVDPTIYSKTRLFRAPNSRHPKTGLHKRRLSLDELTHLKPEAIVRLAERPEPFDIPTRPATCPAAAADWLEAVRAVERHAVERRAVIRDGEPKLSAFARRFIRDGELDGDRRAVSTFRAAAEPGANSTAAHGFAALAHALLTEAALDSGLTPGETRRQIDCGLAHAERQREGGAS